MATNNILPFCPTDTGTNLLTQGDYAIAPDRTNGNQPGVASSKLVNKAMRQATFVSSQLAQYIADKSAGDVLDNGDTARLLAVVNAALYPIPSIFTKKTVGSGTHNCTFFFFIASGNATAGATYTNNTFTFTVVTTIAAGTLLRCTGNGFPTATGTLTKSGGTGDNSITFYAIRKPVQIYFKAVGAGGGGKGVGTGSPGNGTNGGNTSFGTSLVVAAGGNGATLSEGAAPNANTANAGPVYLNNIRGAYGGSTSGGGVINMPGGIGGSSSLGGAGSGGEGGGPKAGFNAADSSGSGGGGGGVGAAAGSAGGGGASGGTVEGIIQTGLAATYAWVVGAKGTGGTAGTSGAAGGNGADGDLLIREDF